MAVENGVNPSSNLGGGIFFFKRFEHNNSFKHQFHKTNMPQTLEKETARERLRQMSPRLFKALSDRLIPVGLPTTITTDVLWAAEHSSIQARQHENAQEIMPEDATDYVLGRSFEIKQRDRPYQITAVQFYKLR
jgi:hypothetical protein